ncbi:period circadian protein isoform X2 [Achroia grisella]|uniref:period circadian protein isoform X2 n=1 Tax=Achroia grisella TaxID=688607 RepID=UPI0027D21657|nr:period circadian protein isoform X2 [Achroia grisella]
MAHSATLILLGVLVSQVYTAPQLITFNDGKLGVNFGGYHAAVGIGGLGTKGGAGGGLFAEAGTPYGQSAKAGLGGAVDSKGGSGGGLYAGATAGGNVRAEAGLTGGVQADKTAGVGYASAQSGNHMAASGLVGDSSANGGSGYMFSGTKSFGVSRGTVKESDLAVQPIEVSKPVQKKVHKEFDFDAANEVNFVALKDAPVNTDTDDENVKTDVQPAVAVKEYKPRHQLRKNAYIGGFLGGEVQPAPVVFQTQPAIARRIDVGVDAAADAGVSAEESVNGGAGNHGVYTKQVTFQRNPDFFADIFNIPISALKAVGNFLTNTAGSTNVSVQKTGSLQADSDTNSSKNTPVSSLSSSDTEITLQAPNVSQVIDDILAIPINTLGAVNKFLENNVPARRKVQVSQNGTNEAPRARLGPHARRRANKQVVIIQEKESPENKE